MTRRRALLGLAVAAGFVLGAASLAPTVVKEVVRRAGAERGFDVAVGEVQVRPTRVWLRGVSVHSRSTGTVRAELLEIAVHVDWRGARDVEVHGGRVELAGTVEELRSAFPKQSSVAESQPSSEANGRRMRGDGLSIVWKRGNTALVTAEAAAFQVDPTTLNVQLGAMGFRDGRVAAELTGIELSLERRAGRILSLLAGRIDASLSLNAAESEALVAAPVVAGTASAPGTDSNGGGLVARLFRLDETRGPRLRGALAKFTEAVARRLIVDHSVKLENVNLRVMRGEQSLNLGPVSVRVSRTSDLVTVQATPRREARGPFGFELEVPLGRGSTRASVVGGPIHLSDLGIHEGDFGLTGVDRAELRVESSATLQAEGDRLEFASHGSARDMGVHQQRLAPVPLTGMDFAWDASGSLDMSGRAFSIRNGEVSIGAVASRVDLSVTRDAERLTLDAQLTVSRASCQKMFDSLPVGAVPLLEGAGLRGDFAWQAGLKFDTDQPLETSASWRMANRCRFETIPELAAPDRFREPFTREVPGPDKEPLEVVSGPGSADWVDLTATARYLPNAVLTTEDGGFWHHKGFDQRAIEEAIRQNLSTGEFQRGASTISMQLAKNLYLSRDKYIARKVQEALLTMLLEQEMRKDELLELYFNVIEYGPGIYGIGPAARHYFNSTPGELSVAQSFFLASILPNPKAQHFEASGALKSKWRAYLHQLMRIAKKRERLTEQELKEGLSEEVRFGVPNLLSNPYQIENGTSPESDATDWVPAPETED